MPAHPIIPSDTVPIEVSYLLLFCRADPNGALSRAAQKSTEYFQLNCSLGEYWLFPGFSGIPGAIFVFLLGLILFVVVVQRTCATSRTGTDGRSFTMACDGAYRCSGCGTDPNPLCRFLLSLLFFVVPRVICRCTLRLSDAKE